MSRAAGLIRGRNGVITVTEMYLYEVILEAHDARGNKRQMPLTADYQTGLSFGTFSAVDWWENTDADLSMTEAGEYTDIEVHFYRAPLSEHGGECVRTTSCTVCWDGRLIEVDDGIEEEEGDE